MDIVHKTQRQINICLMNMIALLGVSLHLDAIFFFFFNLFTESWLKYSYILKK
jgi:hypothetical protein